MTKELTAKIAKIMGEMTAFSKTGKNQGMNFKFVEINEILHDVRPRFAKAGIIMFPTKIEPHSIEFGETRNGGVSTHIFLNVTWTVTDGESEITVASFGEAMDTSDKASNKAQTAAEKQALQKLLLISNEDDNDANNAQRDRRAAPPAPKTPLELAKGRAIDLLKKIEPDFSKWAAMLEGQFPSTKGKGSNDLNQKEWEDIEDWADSVVNPQTGTED